MEILIKIEDRKIEARLLRKGKMADSLSISEEMRLSKKLLPAIDKLIRRNKLEPEDIKRIQVDSDQSDSFTTTRIAKAVANTWNWTRS